MQQTATLIPHVLGHHRNAAKHSCCSILRVVSKHRCMTIPPACSHSGTQEWPPEQDDAGARGPTQLSVRPDSIAAASVSLLLQLAGVMLTVLCLPGSAACAAGSQTVPAVPSLALQHRAQRHLQLLRAARMQLQQAQDQSGLGQVSQAPAQEADTSPSRENGAAVQVQAIPSRQELQGTSTHVARQVYSEVANSRSRLSKRLSAASKQIRALERAADKRVDALSAAHGALQSIQSEFASLARQAEAAAASAQFSVDTGSTVERIQKLAQRMHLLQQLLATRTKQLSSVTPRKVPVSWYGIGQEVRVMGSFDGWATGVLLSAEQLQDDVFNCYTGTLRLTPGTYDVKFLVDGQWRLAPGWPTATTASGDTNNVLTVE